MAGRAHREGETAAAQADFERLLDRELVSFAGSRAGAPFERRMVYNKFAHGAAGLRPLLTYEIFTPSPPDAPSSLLCRRCSG